MTPSPPYYLLEHLAFAAFWSFVVGLDLICLWSLRRSRIEAIARFLWMVWIVAVPIVGAISYFIVQPEPEQRGMNESDLPFNASASSHQSWNENIQR